MLFYKICITLRGNLPTTILLALQNTKIPITLYINKKIYEQLQVKQCNNTYLEIDV